MHQTVGSLGNAGPAEPEAEAQPEFTPAVGVRKSLASREHIISMIDGKSYRTLTRHLGTHGLTPDEYRKRYNLPASYPMTAPSYSEQRREMAMKIGLGRKPGQKSTRKTKSKSE
jgi:predicted transcriptional regulator